MSRAPNLWNLTSRSNKLLDLLNDIACSGSIPRTADECQTLTKARCAKIDELVCAVCACVGSAGREHEMMDDSNDELVRLNRRLLNISADMRATTKQFRMLANALKRSAEHLTYMQFRLYSKSAGQESVARC